MSDEFKKEASEKRTLRPKRQRSVAVYLTILFAVAFLLLLLAFFAQQRSSENVIDMLKNSASTADLLNELIDENRALQEENKALTKQVEEQRQALEDAEAELKQLRPQLESYTSENNILTQERDRLQQFSDTLYLMHWAEARMAEGDYEGAAQLLSVSYPSARMLESIQWFDNAGAPEFRLLPHYDAMVATLVGEGYLIRAEDGALSLPDGT